MKTSRGIRSERPEPRSLAGGAFARPASDPGIYQGQIRQVLKETLGECDIYFFGSRAVGRHTEASDIDVAVYTPRDMPAAISRARELLEASDIPFAVDLVDLRAASAAFARSVRQKDGAVDTLSGRLQSCRRAVTTFAEILQMPAGVIVRDASIQRFEYTFESLWKLLKAYLHEHEGVVCNSPKRCFREALRAGLLDPAQTNVCLAMTDDRNLTAHTYMEALADAIYKRLPGYLTVSQQLLAAIEAESASGGGQAQGARTD